MNQGGLVMRSDRTHRSRNRLRLRLWPGVAAVVLLWLGRFGLKLAIPGFDGFKWGMMATFLFSGVLLLWWLFFSRAHWGERIGGLVLLGGTLAATTQLVHESMGPLWLLGYAVPTLFLAFVAWAVLTRDLPDSTRRTAMVGTVLFACGVWLLVRSNGMDGDHNGDFAWRWTETPEQRALASSAGEGSAARTESAVLAAALESWVPRPAEREWPGFRGPARDGKISGVHLETDWVTSPPVELWRRPVGPGWSSFAVRGDRIFTQEQRGDDEVVACYRGSTGEPIWTHHDKARFFEANAGAGPRSTPTLHRGRVLAFGATGILNALDVDSGRGLWSRNVAEDLGVKLPDWGFTSSPLVVDDLVVVAAGSALAAYDVGTGDLRWSGESSGVSYSSPQRWVIEGIEQVVLPSAVGLTSVAAGDGKHLWRHEWSGFPIVQPAQMPGGDVLLAAHQSSGIRRLAIARDGEAWTVEDRWTSERLKPYFNDFVVHEGHAYGFDSRILACIDLEDGERRWKGGRYGSGQLVLLSDQDLLLVLSEKGEIALVEATPDGFEERARVPAIGGKTWNHPVIAHGNLYVRNAEEAASFALAPAPVTAPSEPEPTAGS